MLEPVIPAQAGIVSFAPIGFLPARERQWELRNAREPVLCSALTTTPRFGQTKRPQPLGVAAELPV